MNYILVTPAKNEAENLLKLIQSVAEQTLKPSLWVIVNDGSTDGSTEIINEAQEKHEWVQSFRLKEHQRDLSKHYAVVCNDGFDFAINYCKMHNLDYDYVGLLDADMIIEREFYSKLIEEFKRNPKLGIASGSVYYDINNRLIIEHDREDLPLGGIRVWRKACFEESGRFYEGYSPDAVSNVLAKLNGWETRRFEGIRAVQTRKTSSAEGLWKGYKYHGESAYFRNYHPLFVLTKGLKYLFEKPPYIGIAYLYGYLSGVIRRIDKIENKEVKDYYYHQKYKEVLEYYTNKLRDKLTVK